MKRLKSDDTASTADNFAHALHTTDLYMHVPVACRRAPVSCDPPSRPPAAQHEKHSYEAHPPIGQHQ